MKQRCQKALFLVALVFYACTDSSGPRTVFMHFALNDISGRPLPTYFAATPGFTTTIVSNTLVLYKDGTAEMVEHRIEWDGTDHTVTYDQQYTIKGSEIDFAYHCAPDAQCIAPPHGTIVGDRLALDVSGGSGAVIYDYQASGQ